MHRDEALAFLTKLAEGIAQTFGGNCETVVHEMDGQRLCNLVLYNGHVSERCAGSTLSIYGNDTTLEVQDEMDLEQDYLNQQVILRGREIKSTTVHMRGEDFHFALGINFDITQMIQMRGMLDSLTAQSGQLSDFIRYRDRSIAELYDNCRAKLGLSPASMKKRDRLALVRLLREYGAFSIQRSVPYVAEQLGVSKYTVYKYLKELEG